MRNRNSLLNEFWRIQATFGLSVVAQALAAWAWLNPADLNRTGQSWLSATLAAIREERARSRVNAVAFLRLYRAIETGYTLAAPGAPDNAPPTTLGELRDEWARTAGTDRPVFPDDDREIEVEDFEWPDEDEEVQDDRAITSLVATGLARVHRMLQEPDLRVDDPEFLAEMESAGRGAANVAQREALRGGRELIESASEKDPRALGWMRVTDDNPCHFCALLASRGAVYKSERAASLRRKPGTFPASWRNADQEELKKFHPRCACQIVPIYTRDDPRVAESRRLYDEYREITKGKSGAAARKAWREHIEAQQRERRQDP